jgi:hypothetical protein
MHFVTFLYEKCHSGSVNGDISIKNLQGGTFAFEQLYLQISESHIPYEVFLG